MNRNENTIYPERLFKHLVVFSLLVVLVRVSLPSLHGLNESLLCGVSGSAG